MNLILEVSRQIKAMNPKLPIDDQSTNSALHNWSLSNLLFDASKLAFLSHDTAKKITLS